MKKLIVYITTFYPTQLRPWHGIFFRDHAEAMARFYDVAVMHLQVPSLRQALNLSPIINTKLQKGVFEISINKPVITHRFRFLINRAYYHAAYYAYEQIHSHFTQTPDYLIAQCVLPAGQIAQALSQKTGIPYGTIDHFTFIDRMFEEQGADISPIYRQSGFTAAVSNFLADKIRAFRGHTAPVPVSGNVLGNMFETNFQPPTSLHHQSAFKWLFVGPDVAKKGVDRLYQAFEKIKDADWQLSIVGQGEYTDLKNSIFSHKITHFPQQNRQEMLSLMQQHHALISTSRIETFGMAIIEMLSQGRPVVVTKSGGPEEYMQPFCGELVAGEDPGLIARSMQRLMREYHTYDAQKIRSYIIAHFGREAFRQKMEDIINWPK